VRLDAAVGAGYRLLDQAFDLGDGVAKLVADDVVAVGAEQGERRAVDDVRPALPVQADDAGGDARQDGFGEAAALFGLAVGFDEFVALSCG
jgi:hypothetical protein